MSRQKNGNREEKQQKKKRNKHALTSLAPPTEQIALPAVNFVKYTCCSHSILLSCCFFSRKMSQKRLRFISADRRSCCAFRRSFEKCCSRFRNSPVDAARRLKCPFSRRIGGQTTFSKEEEETVATVVKWFETMNLSLTRRKFLLFRSDVYVTSLPIFHCSFFWTFFWYLSWFFVFRGDWLNVCTLSVIFLQKLMRLGWQFG